MTCCGQQWSEKRKQGGDECFSCLGKSTSLLLEKGHLYESCSPLVQGETKNAALKPMTAKEECIAAWVGPYCDINAMEWEEDCKQHVYAHATVYKQRANWPSDEEGNCLFTIDDIEFIAQGHHCCNGFDDIQECTPARQWKQDINDANEGIKA